MKVKAIIFGSTGMVGKGVLLECLENENVESVLIVNRQQVNITHPKLKEIIHSDFYNMSSISQSFAGYNACYFCLGASAVAMSEADYQKLTYDLTIAVANSILQVNPELTFCYISGAGTDANSRIMWSRVKGKTENTLLSMPFKNSFMFRPGYIQPLKGIRSKTTAYRIFYIFFKPLYFMLKPFKGLVTDTASVGKAMINVVLFGYSKPAIESSDINNLAGM